MHVWPSTARPILTIVYICPTVGYKDALCDSIDHVQSGRKHLPGNMCTCQTCMQWTPPRETDLTNTDMQWAPPREKDETGRKPETCPTSIILPQNKSLAWSCCTGTWTAPSRTNRHRLAPSWMDGHNRWLPGSWRNMPHSLTAWDKRQRLGEATHPGPEPPRELYLNQRDPIRLCTQNGGWVWNVHSVPPLRVAKRSTPHEALRNWLAKHENAIEPESVEAARQLAKEWEAHPLPKPVRRTRSLPPREISSMSLDSSFDSGSPREKSHTYESLPSDNQPPRENTQPTSQQESIPRKRLRGKTSQTPPSLATSELCPADSQDSMASQSSAGRPKPYGCWDEIYDVLRRPVLVDRHIPRELKTLWQRLVMQLINSEQSRTDLYPIASDLVFILPKLVLSHPPKKGKAKDRLHRIQQCLQQASQGEWKALILRVLEMDTPRYEQDESQPLATSADSLPPRTARRFYKAASQGQLGKAWRQLRALPLVFVGPAQWEEAVAKLTPHATPEGAPSPRGPCTRELALPGSMTMPSPNSRRIKQQTREDGPRKQLRAAWTTPTSDKCC